LTSVKDKIEIFKRLGGRRTEMANQTNQKNIDFKNMWTVLPIEVFALVMEYDNTYRVVFRDIVTDISSHSNCCECKARLLKTSMVPTMLEDPDDIENFEEYMDGEPEHYMCEACFAKYC